MSLRAALLLLAGVAVFALGLLPGHASGDGVGFSHSHGQAGAATPHAPEPHTPAFGTDHDHKGGSAKQHEDEADGARSGVPFCHSAQTSDTLTSAQSGVSGLTQVLSWLLAAALVALVVVLPFPRHRARIAGGTKRSRVPIRLESGPRLLLLDCVARV